MKKYLLTLLLLVLSGAVQALSCNNENSAVLATTPTTDFTLHDDGTATHNSTGLMWMRCSVGQTWQAETCTGTATTFTWQNALTQNGTDYAGYSDWRVPNKNELASIVEQRCYSPSINLAIFPDTPNAWFWSSSPYADYSNSAWYVYFYSGYVDGSYYEDDNGHVRLVRARQ